MKDTPPYSWGLIDMSVTNIIQSDSLTEVNGKVSVTTIGKGDYFSTQMVLRQMKVLGLRCMDVA
jgi:hypothetical protein